MSLSKPYIPPIKPPPGNSFQAKKFPCKSSGKRRRHFYLIGNEIPNHCTTLCFPTDSRFLDSKILSSEPEEAKWLFRKSQSESSRQYDRPQNRFSQNESPNGFSESYHPKNEIQTAETTRNTWRPSATNVKSTTFNHCRQIQLTLQIKKKKYPKKKGEKRKEMVTFARLKLRADCAHHNRAESSASN